MNPERRLWLLALTVVSLLTAALLAGCEGDMPISPLPTPAQRSMYQVYLPDLVVHLTGKGIAGGASADRMAAVGAEWYQRWFICKDSELACISAIKGDTEADRWSEAALDHAAERCTGGYILAGDEYNVRGGWFDNIPRQVAFLHRVEEIVDGRCKIVWGGVGVEPMFNGWPGAASWIREFHDAYLLTYGREPEIVGLHFNAYYWPPEAQPYDLWNSVYYDWIQQTRMAVFAARAVYGLETEVWLREVGCLHDPTADYLVGAFGPSWQYVWQVESVRQFYESDLPNLLDRWAFFISYEDIWDHTSLFDAGGNLTAYGRAYRMQGVW